MPSLSPARIGWLALVFLAATGLSQPALAGESDDLSKARAKFMQATELEQAGNYANALQAFREVAQVRMTPQVRYHIALCEEKLGKLVAALGGYELAMAEAEALGPEFIREVEGRAESLRARIPKLIIERGDGAEAATIELDGVSLGASSIGVEVPLDPGPHAISAKAPGHKGYSSTVEVAERKTERITVTLEAIPVADEPTVGDDGTTRTAAFAPARPSRLVPYLIGGVGAAALLNSGIFFILQRNKDSELSDLCGSDHKCNNDIPRPLTYSQIRAAENANSRLRTYSTITQVSLVAGLVAVGTAAVLIVTEPKPSKPAASAWFFAPEAPGADVAGLSFRGSF